MPNCGKNGHEPINGTCCSNLVKNTAGICDKELCVKKNKYIKQDIQNCCTGLVSDGNYCRDTCAQKGYKPTGMNTCCGNLILNSAGYCDTKLCVPKNKVVNQAIQNCCTGLSPDINGYCKKNGMN
jgi:hypothetical protein